jgi:fructokinase
VNTDTSGCVEPDNSEEYHLYLQAKCAPKVVVLGEVLWDLYDHSRRLGGAPLNFGVHARRLGHEVLLISAVGSDDLGAAAIEAIASLELGTHYLQTVPGYPTGTAQVQTEKDGKTRFEIYRPAAYDAVSLTAEALEQLAQQSVDWFYYGTLFASTAHGRETLHQTLTALVGSSTFYDLNLRPGSDSPELVRELLMHADVVKLNEDELERVHEFTGLPRSAEAFCREGIKRYGWLAAGVTLGDQGCAIFANGEYAEAAGHAVDVVDTVGAGDAFAAAFMHGLSLKWSAAQIASFANRVGALVASRHGAIPAWTLEEAVKL